MVYVRLESLADVRTFTLRIQPIGQICQAYIGENHGKPVATQPGNLHVSGPGTMVGPNVSRIRWANS